nr:hypothetical protein RAR13_04305 [Aminobacter aminovorans]
MTPSQSITALDRQLSAHGETVSVIKYADNGTPTTLAGVRAFVRPAKAEELVEGVDQTQYRVVLAPTGNSTVLPLRKGDKVTLAGGRQLNVELPGPIYVADTLVRVNLTVSG